MFKAVKIKHRLLLLLLLFSTIMIHMQCHQAEKQIGELKDYNLVYIMIDSLRADHLGCYGYKRNTSPFIDTIAASGLQFEQAYSNSSYTRESVSVLFSGRLPSSGGNYGWLCTGPRKGTQTIGTLFKQAGYQTAIISNSIQMKPVGFHAGIDHFECLSSKWGVSRTGPELSRRAAKFMKKNRDKRFFLYLHFLDPHGPYDPPPPLLKQRFNKQSIPNPLGIYKHVRKQCSDLVASGFGPGESRFEDMVLKYDTEIAHTDIAIKQIFNQLKALNLTGKTLVIINSDHGEEFLEHGYVEHAWTLYRESLHVPLIFWAPDKIPAGRILSRVSTVDLLPTILSLMDIKSPDKRFDGEALFSKKQSTYRFIPPKKPYIGELIIQHRGILRTVIKGQWKYIAAQRWLSPETRPTVLGGFMRYRKNPENLKNIWGPIEFEQLFDLAADPKEQTNLVKRNRKKAFQLKGILRLYEAYAKQFGENKGPQPLPSLSEKDKQRLKSLGYL